MFCFHTLLVIWVWNNTWKITFFQNAEGIQHQVSRVTLEKFSAIQFPFLCLVPVVPLQETVESPHEPCWHKILQCCTLVWLLSFIVLGTCGLQVCFWYNFFGFLTSVVSVSLSGTPFLYWTFWMDAPRILSALCTSQLLVLLCYFVRDFLDFLFSTFEWNSEFTDFLNSMGSFWSFLLNLRCLFLTDSFFMIILVLLFMQSSFSLYVSWPRLAVYIASVWKFQRWSSPTGRFHFRGRGQGASLTLVPPGDLVVKSFVLRPWVSPENIWPLAWEVDILGSSGWSASSELIPLFSAPGYPTLCHIESLN